MPMTEGDRSKRLTRRVALLAAGKGALLSALGARMYQLQVIESDNYRLLAEENRINLRLLPPPRGRILDRNGAPFAVNRQNFRVLIVTEQTADLDYTLEALGHVIPLDEDDRTRIRREAERKRSFVPITVRENLRWEDMARIQVNAPDLPGVVIDEGLTRYYPEGPVGAHVLGYVAAVAESDLTGDPLLELPGFRIGKDGVERTYDDALRGTGGTSRVEVNALGRVIQELDRDEGEPGQDLSLTLDLRLQQYAVRRIGEESGTAVVMDVHSGEVLVMASVPAFDPNAFNRGLTQDEWQALVSNEKSPLLNKAVAGTYPPGSTFKMLVALAALEAGVVTPRDSFFCPGHLQLGNHRFHCWKRGGHGHMNMVGGIQQSCDVYFYEVARATGIDRIAAMARRFGLGVTLGIDLPREKAGLIPDTDWKLAALGEPWHPGETLVAGIGQGYTLATPLQLAVMTARMANGGLAVTPRLSRQRLDPDEGLVPTSAGPFEPLGVAADHLAVVRDAMDAVVNRPGGTALRAALDLPAQPEVRMAGKTGTVQVRRITMDERATGVLQTEELPWNLRNHALFVCFAPVEAPRYACAVVIEHGGSGSKAAAPVASDIMAETLRLDPSRANVGPAAEGTIDLPAPQPDEEAG